MDRIERARARRRTAQSILDRLQVLEHWSRVGDPVLVGSVALDLIVEPDIDMEIMSWNLCAPA